MKKTMLLSIGKIAGICGFSAVLLGSAATATAQCGASMAQMAAAAFAISNRQPPVVLSAGEDQLVPTPSKKDDDDTSDIIGLWHLNFNVSMPGVPEPVSIQEAFQIWNSGGTEVHNPRVDPRTGPVCLGTWRANRQTYRLTHRVWSYSPDGVYLGTINLAENVRLTNHNSRQVGTFTLDFFDPDGNPREAFPGGPSHIEGNVVAERISAN